MLIFYCKILIEIFLKQVLLEIIGFTFMESTWDCISFGLYTLNYLNLNLNHLHIDILFDFIIGIWIEMLINDLENYRGKLVQLNNFIPYELALYRVGHNLRCHVRILIIQPDGHAAHQSGSQEYKKQKAVHHAAKYFIILVFVVLEIWH